VLDFHRIAGQLGDFTAYRRAEDARHAARLARAADTLTACAPVWEALADAVKAEGGRSAPLRALPLACPDGCHGAPPRPAAVTVVATDGSQIFPDRHVEPTCYLLNVSRVAFQYGTPEPPLLAAEPTLRYRDVDLAELSAPDEPFFDVTAEVVSALRDQLELEWLYTTAVQARQSARPIVALVDGTLIRWMLRGMKHRAMEDRLIARYRDELERFRQDGIPVASYVSRPGTNEVVNLLRLHLGEHDLDETGLHGLLDRHLFERHLGVGERSALFLSGSRILKEYGPEHHVGFFYVRLPDEVARVELPHWVARQPEWVDLVHAVVLDDAAKGGGYPVALAEAHERAVIRAPEKDLFYRLLERQLGGAGMAYSAKSASKRSPRI
jgi:hypothetical protein